MLVDPSRGLVGTVGGGCGEAEVIDSAHRVLASGWPERVRVDLTEDFTSWSPAVCGGVMDVFVERVAAASRKDERSAERVSIHYLRVPDRLRVYDQRVVVRRDDVVVTLSEPIETSAPLVTNGEVMLERGSLAVWFTFPGAWHDIGRFHRADGRFSGLYANILTPPEMDGPVWRTTDLCLDIWWPSGGTLTLLDEDELEAAVRDGHLSQATARRARDEADGLVALAAAGAWPPPIVEEWTLERSLELLESPSRLAGHCTSTTGC